MLIFNETAHFVKSFFTHLDIRWRSVFTTCQVRDCQQTTFVMLHAFCTLRTSPTSLFLTDNIKMDRIPAIMKKYNVPVQQFFKYSLERSNLILLGTLFHDSIALILIKFLPKVLVLYEYFLEFIIRNPWGIIFVRIWGKKQANYWKDKVKDYW